MSGFVEVWSDPYSKAVSRRWSRGARRMLVRTERLARAEANVARMCGFETFMMGGSKSTSYQELWNG